MHSLRASHLNLKQPVQYLATLRFGDRATHLLVYSLPRNRFLFPLRRGRHNQSLHTRSYSTQDIFNNFNDLYRPLASSSLNPGSPLMEPPGPSSPSAIHKAVSFPTNGGRALSDK
jgi:hypothetical protein